MVFLGGWNEKIIVKFLAWNIVSIQEIELLAANPPYRQEGPILAVVLSQEMSLFYTRYRNVGEDKGMRYLCLLKGIVGCNWLRSIHRPLLF